MTRLEWLKTPYANSTAMDPDGAISSLLSRYGVSRYSIMCDAGPHGRPGYGVRFELDGLWYVICLETLEADRVDDKSLLKQVKRLAYYTLKTLLEASNVFIDRRKLLLPFLEVRGQNLYDVVAPRMQGLQSGSDVLLLGDGA